MFAYQSSNVDWCEGNYLHSENVVEYFNTVSLPSTAIQLLLLLLLKMTINVEKCLHEVFNGIPSMGMLSCCHFVIFTKRLYICWRYFIHKVSHEYGMRE